MAKQQAHSKPRSAASEPFSAAPHPLGDLFRKQQQRNRRTYREITVELNRLLGEKDRITEGALKNALSTSRFQIDVLRHLADILEFPSAHELEKAHEDPDTGRQITIVLWAADKGGKPQATPCWFTLAGRRRGRVRASSVHTLTLTCAHSMLATPLVAAALTSPDGRWRIATCTQGREGLPAWIDGRMLAAATGAGPTSADGILTQVGKWGRAAPLSAQQAIESLKRGSCILAALPADLVANEPDVVRIARVVDSTSGGMLVCPKELAKLIRNIVSHDKKQPIEDLSLSTNEFGEALRTLQAGLSLGVIAERGTLAETLLDATVSSIEDDDVSMLSVHMDLPTHDFSARPFREVVSHAKSTDRRKRDAAAIITWNPIAQWLHEPGEIFALPLHFSPKRQTGLPVHIVFDIFAKGETLRDDRIVQAIDGLIGGLDEAARRIKNLNARENDPLWDLLCPYFGFDPLKDIKTLSKMLQCVRFSVSVSPAWHNRPRPRRLAP